MEKSSTKSAIFFILCSSFCFALMSLFVRLAGDVPTFEKAFFRNLISAIIALASTFKGQKLELNGIKNIKPLVIRSFFGTLGIFCNFYAVDHTLISNASMFIKISPFAALIASYFVLKEEIKPFQAGCIITAFIGVIFIVKPSPNLFHTLPSLVGILGGVTAGIAYTYVRVCRLRGVSSPLIILTFSATSCLASAVFMIKDFVVPSAHQLIMLLLAGAAAAGGQFSITAAYGRAPAKRLAVFEYSQVIFSAALGFVILSELPDTLSFVGYAIIISASLFMYHFQESPKAQNKSS